MSVLQISDECLVITNILCPSSITVTNKTSSKVHAKFFLTNPYQYTLSDMYALLEPSECLVLNVHVLQGANSFNSKNNSIYILYSRPCVDSETPSRNFEIGRSKQNIEVVKIPIRFQIELPAIPEDIQTKMRNYVSVYQGSPSRETSLRHSPFLQQLVSELGRATKITKLEGFVMVYYQKCLEMVPSISINQNKNHCVQSVYTYCYPTASAMSELERSQGLSFTLNQLVSIPSVVSDLTQYDNIISCRDEDYLYLKNMNTNEIKQFSHTKFVMGEYPPFFCVIMQQQFLYFYQNWNQLTVTRLKLKKLKPRCFCKMNNNLYVGGVNKSRLSFKKTTTRRQILVYNNFSPIEGSYSPDNKINLEQSQQPVSMLLSQNPYIVAYCKPRIYLINSQQNQVLIKLDRQIQSGLLLEGRFLKSLVCFVGITVEDRLIKVSFQRMGVVFGVEIDQTPQKVFSVAQSKSGRVFINQRHSVSEYHVVKSEVTDQWKPDNESSIIRLVKTNLKNQLIVLRNDANTSSLQFFSIDS